ncbi:hypothetical protein ASPBRDRAFT_387957 [Aspergillus brasiliensis CBS 101740]|uniref:Uncharacterized protein n=1 Tax=Aspergillus brasiliensis (strain CBS 101740 / IMI 381727 / IBT 21946) TaxID=767769 RepID=A0A1L9UWJ6_ASPBC|nr:hypothetical protein ASPBRDRAFT_387957 [Aspergillus brasiliensis CBS 101740]
MAEGPDAITMVQWRLEQMVRRSHPLVARSLRDSFPRPTRVPDSFCCMEFRTDVYQPSGPGLQYGLLAQAFSSWFDHDYGSINSSQMSMQSSYPGFADCASVRNKGFDRRTTLRQHQGGEN